LTLARYAIRRLFITVVVVYLAASAALLLTRLAPGDFTSELVGTGVSREALTRERARYGLDRSFGDQYRDWLAGLVRADLGTSFRFGRPVRDLVAERAQNTALLATMALLLATGLGLPLGAVSGSRPDSRVAGAIRAASSLFVSVPPLLTSLSLALVAARTGWFPVGGMGLEESDVASRVASVAWHLVLPTIALALPIAATLERLQSQAMSEAIQQPCILLAYGRGISMGRLVWRHALKVALGPVLAVYGVIVGSLLSGSFAVEIVMAWPGLGLLTYDALVSRDVYLVAGCAAAGAAFLALGSMVSDLLLARSDPRVGAAA
jgi:peptide/nickel transport system permease protein